MSRIPWRRLFAVVALALVAAAAWRAFSIFMGPAFEYRRASQSLPVLEVMARDGVTFFREQGWCQVLADRQGTFANTSQSTCALTVDSKSVKPLEGEALRRWKRWSGRVGALPYGVQWLSLRSGPEGDLQEAELCLDVFLGRNYLVYSKGYKLPENEPNEREHTAIDSNWYFVWEDWN